MKLVSGIEKVEESASGRVVAIGLFDGVHLGHQKIVGLARNHALEDSLESAVITFDPHPEAVLSVRPPKLLASFDEKIKLIGDLGIDLLVVIQFNLPFSKYSPRRFCEAVLHKRLSAKEVVVGENFRFGNRAKGVTQDLLGYGKEMGFKTTVVPLVKDSSGETISSSRIRFLVEQGKVEAAKVLLGRAFSVKGLVVGGDKRGAKIGYPTANLSVSPDIVLPKDGVYEVRVIFDDQTIRGVGNVGGAPTFEVPERRIEVHLINWDREIYGREINVLFQRRIRDQKKFGTERDLIRALEQDVLGLKSSFSDSND